MCQIHARAANGVTTTKKSDTIHPQRHESIAHAAEMRDPSECHVDKMMRVSRKTRSRVTSLTHFLQTSQRNRISAIPLPHSRTAEDTGERDTHRQQTRLNCHSKDAHANHATAKVWKQQKHAKKMKNLIPPLVFHDAEGPALSQCHHPSKPQGSKEHHRSLGSVP